MPRIDTILIWFELSATWNKFKVFCSFAFDLVRHWCPLIDHFRSHSTYSHETQPSTIRIVFLSRSLPRSLYTFPLVVREEMLPPQLPENLWISKRLQFQCDFPSIRFELQFVFLHSLFSRKSIPRLIDSHEIYLRTSQRVHSRQSNDGKPSYIMFERINANQQNATHKNVFPFAFVPLLRSSWCSAAQRIRKWQTSMLVRVWRVCGFPLHESLNCKIYYILWRVNCL